MVERRVGYYEESGERVAVRGEGFSWDDGGDGKKIGLLEYFDVFGRPFPVSSRGEIPMSDRHSRRTSHGYGGKMVYNSLLPSKCS